MATCPKCLTDNPDDATTCLGCGRPRFEAVIPAAMSQEFATHAGESWAEQPLDDPRAPVTVMLSPPLPPPMVEPIRPPLTPAPTRLETDRFRQSGAKIAPGNEIGRPYGDRQALDPATALVSTTPTATPPPGADSAPRTPTPQPNERPKLIVLRGQNVGQEYPVYPGRNTVGRFADKPVDIDLNAQEAEGQIWSSRQHAAITFHKGVIVIEDLNSLNGTWLNGVRVHPGQQRLVKPGDVVQIGTVQLKLMVS